MSVWLLNLPTWLREAGLDVDEYPGWETRSRSSGGYDAVRGIGVHHTASNTSPANDMAYCWKNADVKPIGAIILDRTGKITVGAAGATNTQGKGGPYPSSKGTIPKDAGNRYILSIEACNAGNGEAWPAAQIDAYVRMCAVLVPKLGLNWGDIMAHFEWSPGRKYDPAGNSPYASGGALWDMDKFRGDCWLASNPDPTPEPEPEPEPEPGPDPTPPPTEGVVSVDPVSWYIKAGDSPWAVASAVYGDGSKHTELDASAFNSYSTPGNPVFVDTPGVSGTTTDVLSGEGAAAIIRRLTGNPAYPSAATFQTFYDWNGSEHRLFAPGDAVYMPG